MGESPSREAFAREVHDALLHLYDPAYLQSHPLTRFVHSDANARASSLGRALRQAFLDAIESMRPGPKASPNSHPFRRYQVLRLRFVEGLEITQVLDKLSISRSAYFVEQQQAVEAMASLLFEAWVASSLKAVLPPAQDSPQVEQSTRTGRIEVVKAREPLPNEPSAKALPSMSALPNGTITFLYTDLEGSTRAWEQHPKEMRKALERHDAILREAIEGNGGAVFRTQGDGLCAAFQTAPQAVSAALSAQRALVAESWGEVGALRVRMTLHAGAAEVQNGDYVGACMNRIARLLALTHGGQVLVSDVVSDLASDALPEGSTLRDLGEQRLRDLVRPEHIYQLCHRELPDDFPPLGSLDAYPTNLPLQLTSFVGREQEMAEVKRLLKTTRLLTLTGTGGCGKTRLAYQVAADLLDQYPDGVWLVELAALSDPALVVQTIGFALDIRDVSGQPILSRLLAYLTSKQLLLVLDNCEHLLDACARLADNLLRNCPKLQLLATSREALSIAGETRYRVPSLALPDRERLPPLADLAEYESVRLFVERAQAVQPGFALTERNASPVAEICWQLDGIPLAIELSAALVRGLTVEQIERRLVDRFRLLMGGSRLALPRQQTLRATIDWNHDLLSAPEKVLFRRLAAFAGGWTLEAAEEVCAGESESPRLVIERDQVLDLLLRLADRSLEVAEEAGGEGRYRLHETIRQYAKLKLAESGEVDALSGRHRDWCLELVHEAEPLVRGTDSIRWLDRLELEHDNLRAALAWCLESDVESGLEIAGSLLWFWDYHCHFREGSRWTAELLLRSSAETLSRARALRTAGAMVRGKGAVAKSAELLEESVRLCRKLDNKRELGASLSWLGQTLIGLGPTDKAEQLIDEALHLARETGDQFVVSDLLSFLPGLAGRRGNLEQAKRLYEESIAFAREIGSLHFVGYGLLQLGELEVPDGDLARARALTEEALAHFRREKHWYGIGRALRCLSYLAILEGKLAEVKPRIVENLTDVRQTDQGENLWWLRLAALLAMRSGHNARGIRLIGAIDAESQRAPWEFRPNIRDVHNATVAAAREALGAEAFSLAWAEGQAMTLEQAVEYALKNEDAA